MKTIGLAVAVLLAAGPLFREYRPFRIERAGERAGVAAVDAGSYQIILSETSGLTTTEAAGTDTFTVYLDKRPTANVSIGLSSSNTAEATVSPSSLTFTASDWSTPQVVTVTGVDDAWVDGTQNFTIVTAAATSTDPGYDTLNADNVTGSNSDNETVPLLQFAMLDGGGMGAACACGSVHGFWEDGGTAVLTTTRTGVASCLPGAQSGFASGAMTFCGPNLPRVTTYGSLSSLGVLSEAASVNNLSYSDEIDNGAAWSDAVGGVAAATITADYAPGLDGGMTAERLQFPAVAAGQYSLRTQNACPIGASTVGSIFVKGTGGSGEICLVMTGPAATVCSYNSSIWTRCVTSGTTTGGPIYFGTDIIDCPTAQTTAQDVLVEGAQCETSANGATSYIPTKNGTGTRGVETHKFAALPNTMNSGCVAATFIPQYNTYTGNWGPTVVHGANAAFIYGQGNGLRMFDGTNTLTRSLTWDGGVKRVVAQWSAADGGMTLCNTTDNLCTTSAYDGTMPVGGGALLDFCSAVQIGTFAGKATCTDLMIDYTPSRCQ